MSQNSIENNNQILDSSCQALKPYYGLQGKGYLKELMINQINTSSSSGLLFKTISLAEFAIKILIIIQFFQDPTGTYNSILLSINLISSMIQLTLIIEKQIQKINSLEQTLFQIVCCLLQFDCILFNLANKSQLNKKFVYLSFDCQQVTSILKNLVYQVQFKRYFLGFVAIVLLSQRILDTSVNTGINLLLLITSLIFYFLTNLIYLQIFVLEKNYSFADSSLIVLESIFAFGFSVTLVITVVQINYISYIIALLSIQLIYLKLLHGSSDIFGPFVVGSFDQLLLGGQICYLLPLIKKDFNQLYMLLQVQINKISLGIYIIFQVVIQIEMIQLINSSDMNLIEVDGYKYIYLAILVSNCLLVLPKLIFWIQFRVQCRQLQVSSLSQIDIKCVRRFYHLEIYICNTNQNLLLESDYQIIYQLLEYNGGFLSIGFNNQFLIQIVNGHVDLIFNCINQNKQAEKLYLAALEAKKSINLDIILEQQCKKEINIFLMSVLKNNIVEKEEKHIQNRQQIIDYFKQYKQFNELVSVSENFNNIVNEALYFQIAFKSNISQLLMNNPNLITYDLYEEL